MTRFSRIVQALGVSFLLVFLLSACGGDGDRDDGEPDASGPVVAQIGSTAIHQSEYERAKLFIAESTAATPGAVDAVPDPPRFHRCIEDQRRAAAAARRRPVPGETELERACRDLDLQNGGNALTRLIQATWWEQEAERRGIEITDSEMQTALRQLIASAHPRPGSFERLLDDSGLSEDDWRQDARTSLLTTRVLQDVQADVEPVDDAALVAYYDAHRAEFTLPERRDLELVIAATEARAQQARDALLRGEEIADVTREYSDSPLTRALEGRLDGVAPGGMSRAFETQVFTAAVGEFVGPVRGDHGWYVGRTVRITPAGQQSLDEVREPLRAMLTQQRQADATNRFNADFTRHWRAETICRAFFVPDCGNAPRAPAARGEESIRVGPDGRLPESLVRQLNEQRARELAERREQAQR